MSFCVQQCEKIVMRHHDNTRHRFSHHGCGGWGAEKTEKWKRELELDENINHCPDGSYLVFRNGRWTYSCEMTDEKKFSSSPPSHHDHHHYHPPQLISPAVSSVLDISNVSGPRSFTIEDLRKSDELSIEGFVGMIGPRGHTGPNGIDGTRGMKGDRGERGLIGPTGPRGPRGERGERGLVGIQGEQGFKGDPGPRGPKGDVGDPGDVGPTGDRGDRGERGERGEKGERGGVGPAGPVGERGERGLIGPTGPIGDVGAAGPTGPIGDKGEIGMRGERGSTGVRGDVGPTGPAGMRGERGLVGPMGLPGEEGPRGMVGPTGPIGLTPSGVTINTSNVVVGMNTAINSLGVKNTYIGNDVCATEESKGSFNTVIGTEAGHRIERGVGNTVIGTAAGSKLTDANFNTVIGQSSGQNLQVGTGNVFIGNNAGDTAEEANNCVCIGNECDVSHAQALNQIVFGNGTVGAGDNTITFPYNLSPLTSGVEAHFSYSTGGCLYPVSSSNRYKENIESLESRIDTSAIYNLTPRVYNPKPGHGNPQEVCVGLIAEEVDEHIPILVPKDQSGRAATVKYSRLPVFIIAEMKKLVSRIKVLEERLN